MNIYDAQNNFVKTLEQERYDRNKSVKVWARELGISRSGYLKIIRRETKNIPFLLFLRLHDMTGMFAFEMIQEPPRDGYTLLLLYKELDDQGKRLATDYVLSLLKNGHKKKPLP